MEETPYTLKDFIQDNFKIRNKKSELVNLKFNNMQEKFYDIFKDNYGKRPSRFIVLKARQLGFSTLTEALLTGITIQTPNTNSIIMAHVSDSASAIFNMTKLYYDALPQGLKPSIKNSNAKELVFDNDKGTGLKSAIRIMVASDSVRGSTYKLAHLSEVAFWDNAENSLLALNQTIPMTDDSLVIIESTANGFNHFYNLWQDAVNGRNDYIPVFFAWYEDPDYTMPYTGFELTSYEQDIKERFNLTLDQLQWRRWCIANNCGGDDVKFRQEYPITPEEAFITSGSSVFSTEKILEHMKSLKEPLRTGYFKYDYDGLKISNIQFVDDKQGYIKIYAEPGNGPYAIGGDTAGEGDDYFAAHVLDKDGFLCAVLHHQFDADMYAKQMYCLGYYYANEGKPALLGPEANFDSFAIRELQRFKYTNLYVRKTYDQITPDVQDKFGFRTTSITRPLIISQLVEIVREEIFKINDRETLQEMLSFVRINGKPQASEGTHDDLVMSLAIAYEVLTQLPRKITFAKTRKKETSGFYNYGRRKQ